VRRFGIIASLVLGAACLYAGEPAFTTRVSFESPVTVSSFTESKVYGFESVLLENDGEEAVSFVQLMITFRTDSGDEIVADRRFQAGIGSRSTKRIIIDLGQKEALRQKMKPGPDSKALAILTIKAIELADGRVWQSETAPLTLDPLVPAGIQKR
jgi:hypothetical protein